MVLAAKLSAGTGTPSTWSETPEVNPIAADATSGPDRVMMPIVKLYFRIGDVARLAGIKPYVLRYWETEFRSIRPQKTRSRQRLYRRKDLELLLRIRHLLRRFLLEGDEP